MTNTNRFRITIRAEHVTSTGITIARTRSIGVGAPSREVAAKIAEAVCVVLDRTFATGKPATATAVVEGPGIALAAPELTLEEAMILAVTTWTNPGDE